MEEECFIANENEKRKELFDILILLMKFIIIGVLSVIGFFALMNYMDEEITADIDEEVAIIINEGEAATLTAVHKFTNEETEFAGRMNVKKLVHYVVFEDDKQQKYTSALPESFYEEIQTNQSYEAYVHNEDVLLKAFSYRRQIEDLEFLEEVK